MSQRQIEVVRRLNEAFNAREADWTRFYDEQVEFHMPPEWPDDPVLRGRAGVVSGVGLWEENLDDYGWDAERLIEGPDCVVGLFRHRGRIRGTDQRVENPIAGLFFFEGDRIVRVVSYTSWVEALDAAGLSRDLAIAPDR